MSELSEMIQVLWIDDEHENLLSFKGQAKREGIQLVPFKSLEAGLGELEKNPSYYDALLLDAKFMAKENDASGTEDTANLHKAYARILQMPKKFEIHVFTGQAEAYDDQTTKKIFKNIYNKGKPEDNERLFVDLKKAALESEDTQLKYQYKDVFEVCTDKYIGAHVFVDVLILLKEVRSENAAIYFTTLRKIIEDVFRSFNRHGLLPDVFVIPKVYFNESSKFLKGKNHNGDYFIEKGFKHFDQTHLPKVIANHLRTILPVVQDGSHRSRIDEHVRVQRNSYLLQSVMFQLFDLIVWFKTYIDSSPEKQNWEEIGDWLTGTITKINHNGYGTLLIQNSDRKLSIPNFMISENDLSEYDIVRVTTKPSSDGKKAYIQHVKKIN